MRQGDDCPAARRHGPLDQTLLLSSQENSRPALF
jgi:hypothetical protein